MDAQSASQKMPPSQAHLVASLVSALEAAGVRHAVLSPGYRNAPLSLALWRSSAIETTVVIDERTAGFVALGAARATSIPVVLCCTSGSAPAHYLPAIVEAHRSRVPLLVLSADRPYELQRVGAPQAVEQRGLFSSHVIWEDELVLSQEMDADVPPACTPALTRLALALAYARRGPVHLNVPLRKPLGNTSEADWSALAAPRVFPARRCVEPGAMSALREAAKSALRPVIVHGPEAGPLSDARAQGESVLALAGALGWPLVADGVASSRRARHSIHHAELLLRDRSVREALAPDFVLWIGAAPTGKWVSTWLAQAPAQRWTLVPHLEWVDPAHQAVGLVEGMAADVLNDVTSRGPAAWSAADPAWIERWAIGALAVEDALDAACTDRWWDGGVVRLAALHWPGPWLHVGSSLPVRDLDAFTTSAASRGGSPGPIVTSNRGANGIDGTLATAWGEAWGGGATLGHPGLVIMGDVTALHDVGSFLQLPSHLPLVVLVINNGGGQIFGQLPIRDTPGFEEVFLTPPALDLCAISRAAGVPTVRVDTAAGLLGALRRGWEDGRLFIEAVVDGNASQHARNAVWNRCVERAREALL